MDKLKLNEGVKISEAKMVSSPMNIYYDGDRFNNIIYIKNGEEYVVDELKFIELGLLKKKIKKEVK